jgi:formylglycine-generating enzyme
MVYVPPGAFSMGEDREGTFDQKPHAVRVTRSFFIGAGPVTVGQFRRFTDETGYRTIAEKEGAAFTCVAGGGCRFVRGASWRNPGFDQDDDHPVVVIGWDDAVAFADWASRKTGKPFRLPTEAEWEWAARGPSPASTAPRSEPIGARVDLHAFTSPVGRVDNASWVGATDMLGNVWEWCSDWYARDYYATSPVDDPRGPLTGLYRVLRGCSWMTSREDCGPSSRGWFEPLLRANTRGFRVAVDGVAFAGPDAGT